MKRILNILLIAGLAFSSSALFGQGVKRPRAEEKPYLEQKEKSQKVAAVKNAADTKYICTIGLEGEGSFTEVFANRAECKKYCKGGATVCEKTFKKTKVNIDEVD